MRAEPLREHRAHGVPAIMARHIGQDVRQRLPVLGWEQRLSVRAESIGVGRGTRAPLLSPILDQALRLQFLEMAAHGIGGHAENVGKFLCRKRLRPLQLEQDIAAKPSVASEAGNGRSHGLEC